MCPSSWEEPRHRPCAGPRHEGDGWYGSTLPLEENLRVRDEIERYRRESGRAKRPFTYYTRISGDSIPKAVERFRSAGFTNLVIPSEAIHPFSRPDQSLQARLRSLEAAAAELGLTPR